MESTLYSLRGELRETLYSEAMFYEPRKYHMLLYFSTMYMYKEK